MEITWDGEFRSIYIHIKESGKHTLTQRITDEIRIDWGESEVIGISIFNASKPVVEDIGEEIIEVQELVRC